MATNRHFRPETTVFLTKPDFDGYRDFHILSVEICKVLKCKVCDIFPHIFTCRSLEIQYTMSLYVHKVASGRVTLELTRCIDQIKEKKDYVKRSSTHASHYDYLTIGPFGQDCKYILKQAVRSYYLYEDGKLATDIQTFAEHVSHYFSQELVKSLLQRFEIITLKPSYLFKAIFLSKMPRLEKKLVTNYNVLNGIEKAVMDSLAKFSVEFEVFIRKLDDDIVKRICIGIQSNRKELANELLLQFFGEMGEEIEHLEAHVCRLKYRVETETQFKDAQNRFRTVIERNPLVCKVDPPQTASGNWSLYVEDKEANETDIKDYIKQYLGNDIKFDIDEKQNELLDDKVDVLKLDLVKM